MAKVWKYALLNAVRYKKSPKADAVLKKLLAEDFELRKGAKVPPTSNARGDKEYRVAE